MFRKLLISVSLLVMLAACTGQPVRDPKLAAQATPRQVAAQPVLVAPSQTLVWGGVLQSVSNLAQSTRLEILAYPLDTEQKPMLDQPADGRFWVDMPGFLEPHDLPRGMLLTAVGGYQENLPGKVGEAAYTFPVLRGTGLLRWGLPQPPAEQMAPAVRWSIGVGSSGSGVGVGIGF